MIRNRLFARKSLETLLAEMKGENRLRRVLGPIALTSLGVGAIIGTFVEIGRKIGRGARLFGKLPSGSWGPRGRLCACRT